MDDAKTVAFRYRFPTVYGEWKPWHYSEQPIEYPPADGMRQELVLRSDYASLAKRVRELEADAARYRWLRRQNWSGSDTFVVSGGKERVHLATYCPNGGLLDSHVDAAMQQDDSG